MGQISQNTVLSDVPAAWAETSASVTAPAPTKSEGVVLATSFLLKLIAEPKSRLVLDDDGFYFTIPEAGEYDAALISALDSIVTNGFYVDDFQYGNVMSALIERKEFPGGRFRIGGSLQHIDPDKFPAFDKGIIGGEQEGYFEFFPGAQVPANRDEFIAALWRGGIKCGIDTSSLESTLAEGLKKPGKYLVARAVSPTEGADAKPIPRAQLQPKRAIKEAGKGGRDDLHFYECSFPQVPSGPGPHPLLEKVPAVLGKSGRSVDGKVLAARPVKDFDLTKTAGPGTRVMELDGKTVVVTDLGGHYIEVDPKRQISISPHAKNSFPVGPKTGSFEVEVDTFEQGGDIEREYRLVVRNAEIVGNVRGSVTSKSGHVHLMGNAENGGVIEAESGDVKIEGKAFGARIVALGGKITVAKAEGSVLIAREVEITGSAVNCFVIADTIRIKKAGGTSFYAQNVAIEELDMTDGSYNPVTGFIALRDNLKARKAIRRFEKRRRRLEKVEQMESFIREQGLSEAWAALDARMSTKEPLTPEETHQFGPLLQPYEYVRRRKNMVVKDRDFFADSGNVAEYEAALKAIETHEENMRGAVKLSLGSLAYPPELIKSISETAATNLSAAMRLAPHTISAYVSSDPSIAELSKAEDKWKRHFIGHFSKMLAGNVVNEARIRRLKSLALLKSNCDLGYETLKELAVSDDEDEVMEERRNDSARIEIGNELVIPVMIDNYSMGRMRNVSDHGISVFFDDTQDNPPVFEKLEEVQVSFKIGDIEHRYPFAVTVVIENDSAGLVKIGGFYAHANEDVLNKTRRLRTEIETALAKKRRGGG